MEIRDLVLEKARAARRAAEDLAVLPTTVKNAGLKAMADALEGQMERILKANQADLETARNRGIASALLDRLALNGDRVRGMARGLREVAELPDPVGRVYDQRVRPNGLRIEKVRVPIGVIGIIYEARPNITSDVAGLCLKSGNATVLRGGSEALNSNLAIAQVLEEAATSQGLPPGAIQFIDIPDHRAVEEMLKLDGYIDLIIPRGGESLIRTVVENSRIPVIKHYKGVCHTYVDRTADLGMAEEICHNAKVQRPGVCNAMETLLVHQEVAAEFLPRMFERYRQAGVELRGCERTRELFPDLKEATEEDWYAEYLDLILAIRIVDGVEEAIEHITKYGSKHTDAIISRDEGAIRLFVSRVDSSSVMVNTSTRFSDGGEYGLGAEIGISTDKIHARGPMALEELTIYKWVVWGDGQLRG